MYDIFFLTSEVLSLYPSLLSTLAPSSFSSSFACSLLLLRVDGTPEHYVIEFYRTERIEEKNEKGKRSRKSEKEKGKEKEGRERKKQKERRRIEKKSSDLSAFHRRKGLDSDIMKIDTERGERRGKKEKRVKGRAQSVFTEPNSHFSLSNNDVELDLQEDEIIQENKTKEEEGEEEKRKEVSKNADEREKERAVKESEQCERGAIYSRIRSIGSAISFTSPLNALGDGKHVICVADILLLLHGRQPLDYSFCCNFSKIIPEVSIF